MDDADDPNSEDTFKILVATDCHLGYAEKDPERGNDSFVTFEEIMRLGQENDVDFVLLGGDLFHENKPSRYAMHECIRIIRKYSLGSKPVQFDVLTDLLDEGEEMSVNYKDPNLNVSHPVFSIHGNHDDPAGHGWLCSLDLLGSMGLVNHFGKCLKMDSVRIKPLLLLKGETRLALYGLGSVRDERLHRIFREGNVTMVRPASDLDCWFNLLVLHQNRFKHSMTSYIPEDFLDDFLDLVVWGHEHECLLTPERSASRNFFVSQPGSSVATSLSVGESTKKQVGLLYINKNNFKMMELPLKTVRPFCFKDIALSDISLDLTQFRAQERVMEYCQTLVSDMINDSQEQLTGDKSQPKMPLIRLRVEYQDDSHMFSSVRFATKFRGKVANPQEIILFHRKRQSIKAEGGFDAVDFGAGPNAEELDLNKFSAVDLVQEHFANIDEKYRLQLLTETGLGKAVKEFVDKEEKEAIGELVKHQIGKTQTYLCNRDVTENNILEQIAGYREERRQKGTEEDAEVTQALAAARKKRIEEGDDSEASEVSANDDDDAVDVTPGPAKGGARGRGRGRGGRGAALAKPPSKPSTSRGRGSRGGGRGRGSATPAAATLEHLFEKSRSSGRAPAAKVTYIVDESDSDAEQETRSKRKRSSPASAASKKARGIVFDSGDEADFF